MSFFFQTIAIPFWFVFFVFASATPLWIKWYKKFHNKFIITGVLQRKFRREKTATDPWNENSGFSGFSESTDIKRKPLKKRIDPTKKKNIQTVLKMLAASGEVGILAKSLSDKAKINSIETTSALSYLIEKKYAESINATTGTKYYLTDLGRRYCINKMIPLE